MDVLRVFNNNVVLARDGDREGILTGRGIGFQAKPGQHVDDAKIVRRFIPVDGKDPDHMAQQVAGIPPEIIRLVTDAMNRTGLKEQADKLKTTLEQVKLIPPVDLKPFVYVRISEHPDIPLEEAMPLNQAVELFGKLDRQAVEEKDMAGYYKTHFEICFLSEGEVMSYTGRQDFGDGEGNLLDHVKAFADYYLHTEEGQKLMKQTARTTEEWEHEQQQMRWVLEEMLPTLQYFCNLEKLETAVLEEQEIEKKVPLLTQGDASRKAYQEAMLAYIRESRIALNTGKELPCMPDIRDFATACPDKSYKEQVMEEIRQEAESYGMTVEAYAANGYEPPKRGGR